VAEAQAEAGDTTFYFIFRNCFEFIIKTISHENLLIRMKSFCETSQPAGWFRVLAFWWQKKINF
jgi:hypothetical protein